jgi:hypothetical protein
MPLVVIYEDLCRDAQAVITAIAHHVGVPDAVIGAPVIQPRVQRDERSLEWRERFVRESGDLGVLPLGRVVTFDEHLWRPSDGRAAVEPRAEPRYARL